MTTELVILITVFMVVVVGIFKLPAQSFEQAGPKLGMRIEKQIETGYGFTKRTMKSDNPVSWEPKR